MRKITLPFFAILALVIAPELFATSVYKGKDSNGNLLFSDQPIPNGEKIDIKPIQTYSTPSLTTPVAQANDNGKDKNKEKEIIAYQLHILQPKNEENFTGDIADVSVNISVTPELAATDKIRFLLNSKPHGELSHKTSTTLNALERGAYTLQAEVVSPNGKIKGQSDTVTFFQKRPFIRNHSGQ